MKTADWWTEILRYGQHKASEGFYVVNVRAGTDLDAALGTEQDIAMVLQPGCTAQPPREELRNLNAPTIPQANEIRITWQSQSTLQLGDFQVFAGNTVESRVNPTVS